MRLVVFFVGAFVDDAFYFGAAVDAQLQQPKRFHPPRTHEEEADMWRLYSDNGNKNASKLGQVFNAGSAEQIGP